MGGKVSNFFMAGVGQKKTHAHAIPVQLVPKIAREVFLKVIHPRNGISCGLNAVFV